MTHEHESELAAAALVVTNITLKLAMLKKEHRAQLTDRHRRMLNDAAVNFETASKLLWDIAHDRIAE